MWERFSYYGMRALLILFMTAAPAAGGLGFDAVTAGAIYGLYTSMVYMMTLPGGWIADRLIGQQRAVLVGGILIACGHFSMAVPVAHDVLSRSRPDRHRHRAAQRQRQRHRRPAVRRRRRRRDAGFSIFYMGINTGAFVAPLVCGYLGQRVNWHLGFAAAGIGMVLGLVQYVLGGKYLGEAGLHPADPGSPTALAEQKRQAARWLGAGVGRAGPVRARRLHRRDSGHADADRRRRRLPAARPVGRLLRLGVSRQAAGRASSAITCIAHRRALRRLRAVLVRRSSRPVRR